MTDNLFDRYRELRAKKAAAAQPHPLIARYYEYKAKKQAEAQASGRLNQYPPERVKRMAPAEIESFLSAEPQAPSAVPSQQAVHSIMPNLMKAMESKYTAPNLPTAAPAQTSAVSSPSKMASLLAGLKKQQNVPKETLETYLEELRVKAAAATNLTETLLSAYKEMAAKEADFGAAGAAIPYLTAAGAGGVLGGLGGYATSQQDSLESNTAFKKRRRMRALLAALGGATMGAGGMAAGKALLGKPSAPVPQ